MQKQQKFQARSLIDPKDTVIAWIVANITEPIYGFEHKKNDDGSEYNREQQIQATYHQMVAIVQDFSTRGKTKDELMEILHFFKK